MKLGPVLKQNSVQLLHEATIFIDTKVFKMKRNFLILMPVIFGVITADYVGPQNGFRNGNGNGNGHGNGHGNGNGHRNGNGNSYGVPPDSITPPQPQGGPYPPSGWKPAGPRLLLPGESRSAQQPIDSGYGQPPPSQYGPVNSSPSGPSIDSQYGPSVDNTGPPNNQYIPGTGFGNGGNGGNDGNGHSGNGGTGHNSGNGNGNGNAHNGGNGFPTGNGNGNAHNGNGNGHKGGNGFSNGSNGNGVTNGSGQNGANGGTNGNGNKGSNGANDFAPAFHGAFPGGLIYPFVQHSIPAVLAFRGNGHGTGHGNIYPIHQVPISPPHSGIGIIASSFPSGQGVFHLANANPSFQIPPGITDLGFIHPSFHVAGAHDISATHPAFVGQGTGLIGHGIGQYYTLISNHQSQNSNILGVKNRPNNLQLQQAIGNTAYGNDGVPLSIF